MFEAQREKMRKVLAQAGLLWVLVAYVTNAVAQDEIKGSGATFPALIYSAWAFAYTKEKRVNVSYKPTGSGEGIRSISAREVDFGATDSPLTDVELKKQGLIQFPTLVGGVVPVVNLPGIGNGQLKLTGSALAAIFAGKVKTWNDPILVALNPTLRLPATKIIRAVREDSSGTTEVFVNYLASAYRAWPSGIGKKVNWSGEVSAVKGNDGVAQLIKSTAGAIGYVSLDRVTKSGLKSVSLQNKAGNYVMASESSLLAAAINSGLRKDLRASLLNSDGNDSWPITDLTYILVEAEPKSADAGSRTVKFFYWAMLKGDDIIRGTGFAPLPPGIQARVVRRLSEMKSRDGKSIEFISM